MPPAGYSGTPLVKKLGIKAGMRVALIDAPDTLLDDLDPLPEGVRISSHLRGKKDFIHIFVQRERALDRRLPTLKRVVEKDGSIWISWPKKASGIATELTGNDVRRLGLAHGLVDIKVCAVDDTWSGLKFVYRLADR